MDQYLKEKAPVADVPPVMAFETGNNTWRRLTSWPAGCPSGCTIRPTPLYLAAGLKLWLCCPRLPTPPLTNFISDPAKPVPFRARPIQPVGYDKGLTWPQWLVDDQRGSVWTARRAVFISDSLTAPTKISGQPVANLVGLHHRLGFGLGSQADRRLPRSGRQQRRWVDIN